MNETAKEINPNTVPLEDATARILVADDDKLFQELFKDLILDMGHEILMVDNAMELLEKVKEFKPDIILSDVVMPGIDGFELTRRLKADPQTMHIPVVIITSLSDRSAKVSGLEAGADELLNKPIDETELSLRIRNLLKVKRFEDYLMEHGKSLSSEVASKTVQLENAFEKIRSGYIETVNRLTLAAEYRDKETGSHIKRISLCSQLLARYCGLDEPQVEAIFFGSPMHDVGKIGIPDSILLKPGKHTEEEFETMKTHSVIGADILRDAESEILIAAREIALSHHEAWDGSGYPDGLKGEEIPISGRIVRVADVYDALRSARPYKKAMTHEEAYKIMYEQKDKFDPSLLKAFDECQDEFRRLFDENQESD
ncbi:MAG: response regulator [Proteobacteria bacterium]|nr:response regulator [Pseudomonadota bacterium]